MAISAEHKLIDSGPIVSIRHPTYTGALLAFLGLEASCFGNWLSILFLTLPIIAAFLLAHRGSRNAPFCGALGEDYRAYAGPDEDAQFRSSTSAKCLTRVYKSLQRAHALFRHLMDAE